MNKALYKHDILELIKIQQEKVKVPQKSLNDNIYPLNTIHTIKGKKIPKKEWFHNSFYSSQLKYVYKIFKTEYRCNNCGDTSTGKKYWALLDDMNKMVGYACSACRNEDKGLEWRQKQLSIKTHIVEYTRENRKIIKLAWLSRKGRWWWERDKRDYCPYTYDNGITYSVSKEIKVYKSNNPYRLKQETNIMDEAQKQRWGCFYQEQKEYSRDIPAVGEIRLNKIDNTISEELATMRLKVEDSIIALDKYKNVKSMSYKRLKDLAVDIIKDTLDDNNKLAPRFLDNFLIYIGDNNKVMCRDGIKQPFIHLKELPPSTVFKVYLLNDEREKQLIEKGIK